MLAEKLGSTVSMSPFGDVLEAETGAQEVVGDRIARVGLKRLARERDGARLVLVRELHNRGVTSGRGVRRGDRQRLTKRGDRLGASLKAGLIRRTSRNCSAAPSKSRLR